MAEKRKFESRFNGWKTVQQGIACKHKAIEFRRAGAIPYDLFNERIGGEKAVDVKLACDLLELRENYVVAIIVSGDQAYVPAIQILKDKGKQVVNVAFQRRNGELLPGGARWLNEVCDESIQVSYGDLRKHMCL